MILNLLIAGFGGQGVLFMGKAAAETAMLTGKEVSWLPSYGPEMRGGTANCSVVVSDRPVASPLINVADTVLAMNKPSLLKFEGSVKSGGLLLINSSIIDIKTSREDVDAVYVPCNEIAESIGNLKGPNVVFLGAYIAKRPDVISEDAIINAMRIELGEKKAKFLDGNIKALQAGMAYVKEHYGV